MYKRLDNYIYFYAYREEGNTTFAVYAYDEKKVVFADSFVHVTDVLKGDFSITRIKAEPCEITMYQALDFLLEARRRNLMESTNRLIEASNLWIYNYYNNENLSFHYNFEERIVSDKSCANALYDQSFINELKNIEEHENASDFRGNMVHYVISGRSNEAVRDMAETLIQNLIKANRVSSRRLELITEIEPDMYSARNYLEDIIDGNFGGAIVIDLTEKVGCDPVDYTLVSKYIINLLKKYRNECLFIFTYNMDNPGFSYQILPEIEKYVVPVMLVIRELDDDQAVVAMVDSNLHRENLKPSEKAFAYKMKMDAMRRTAGRPTKENPRQNVGNYETADLIGKDNGESGRQVQRYIRLTELIPELLDLVDKKKLQFTVAIDISYIDKEVQEWIYEYISDTGFIKPKQIAALRNQLNDGPINQIQMLSIFNNCVIAKKVSRSLTFSEKKLTKYFPDDYTAKDMEQVIESLLEKWMQEQSC